MIMMEQRFAFVNNQSSFYCVNLHLEVSYAPWALYLNPNCHGTTSNIVEVVGQGRSLASVLRKYISLSQYSTHSSSNPKSDCKHAAVAPCRSLSPTIKQATQTSLIRFEPNSAGQRGLWPHVLPKA